MYIVRYITMKDGYPGFCYSVNMNCVVTTTDVNDAVRFNRQSVAAWYAVTVFQCFRETLQEQHIVDFEIVEIP